MMGGWYEWGADTGAKYLSSPIGPLSCLGSYHPMDVALMCLSIAGSISCRGAVPMLTQAAATRTSGCIQIAE